MKIFMVIFGEKQPHLMKEDLIKKHTYYLEMLHSKKRLILSGPFEDNMGAVLIVRGKNREEVEDLLDKDPFVKEDYYQKVTINEIIEATPLNNWLIDRL